MDLGGLGNKIISPISKNSELIGAGLAVWHEYSIGSLQSSIQNLLGGHVHAPDVSSVLVQLRTDSGYVGSIAAVIGGYLAQESGIGVVKQVGAIAVKAGTAYFVTRLAMLVLHASTHSEGGNSSAPTGAGYSY